MMSSLLCVLGGEYAGYFLMDLYEIVDDLRFSESVDNILATTESTMATTNGAAATDYSYSVLLFIVVLFVL